MSVGEAFQLTGAGAGLVSLVWLVLTQLWGTYEARTIRQVLTQQNETLNTTLKQFERLVGRLERARRGRER